MPEKGIPMNLANELKSQVEGLSKKVLSAEKNAAKQVRTILKGTEKFRSQQLKKLQQLAKRGQQLKSTDLGRKAQQVRDQIEAGAQLGWDFLLQKLDLPSKKDLERLTKKVSSLQKKIDELETKK